MPFLRARQMMCFPFGVSIARNRKKIESVINRRTLTFLGGVIGLLFMGITQMTVVKEMPYLFQNVLSLFTVFPLALAALSFTKCHNWLLHNCVLNQVGLVSFEIYLVHAFTMEKLQLSFSSFISFLSVTALGVWLLHTVLRKGSEIWSI